MITLNEFINYCQNNITVDYNYNNNYDSEIILKCKNGNKIHIKKKNKGKFTSWCGGKVTDECIKRGKNSSNPVIRKRATFAANARTWSKK